MHGASRARAIRRVTVPLLRVPLTSTFLLLLMLSMRELTVPLFLFTSDTRLLSIVIFDDFENGVLQRAPRRASSTASSSSCSPTSPGASAPSSAPEPPVPPAPSHPTCPTPSAHRFDPMEDEPCTDP